MTARWTFVPSAPLLALASDELLAEVRSAALGAVAGLVRDASSVTVLDVIASGPDRDANAGGSLTRMGLPVHAGGPEPVLGLGHTIGAWLLDTARWRGPRRYTGSVTGASEDRVLVVADGYACVNDRSPLRTDPRGAKAQAEVVDALGRGDAAALAALDVAAAASLGCSGAPTLVEAGRAGAGRSWEARVTYDDAPLGVGYWVATWELVAGP